MRVTIGVTSMLLTGAVMAGPLGAPVAFVGVVAILVGGLWDTPLRGAIALLSLVSSLWVVDCFWRRDTERAPGHFQLKTRPGRLPGACVRAVGCCRVSWVIRVG